MSSWSQALAGWARSFSPLTSPRTSSSLVTERDYSYMTAEDIAKEEAEIKAARAKRPPRDSDVMLFKHRDDTYVCHFKPYCIDDGDLTVGSIRKAAAKKLVAAKKGSLVEADYHRVKLFLHGTALAEDTRKAREEGMASDKATEIFLVIEEDSRTSIETTSNEEPGFTMLRKKKKLKKTSGSKKAQSTPAPSSSKPIATVPLPDAIHPTGTATPPPAPKADQTPMQKLEEIEAFYVEKYEGACLDFVADTPKQDKKRTETHNYLTDAIVARVQCKLDTVEAGEDEVVRVKRKAIVNRTQDMLKQLDEAKRVAESKAQPGLT